MRQSEQWGRGIREKEGRGEKHHTWSVHRVIETHTQISWSKLCSVLLCKHSLNEVFPFSLLSPFYQSSTLSLTITIVSLVNFQTAHKMTTWPSFLAGQSEQKTDIVIRYNSVWRANQELVTIHNEAAHKELVKIYNRLTSRKSWLSKCKNKMWTCKTILDPNDPCN